jgi:hypothetical protein
VVNQEPVASVLYLSEDSGKYGDLTVRALSEHIFRVLVPNCRLDLVRFEPEDQERLRGLVRGNLWKSTRAEDRRVRVDLISRIATKIAEKRPGFVIFHIDGDRPWANQDDSENRLKAMLLLMKPVLKLIKKRNKPYNGTHLIFMMPFYSIEAWLYQNDRRAIEILHEKYAGSHVAIFEEWASDRTLLDEVVKPKEGTPLRDGHNLELAGEAFPAGEIFVAGKSFSACVERFRRCDGLLTALKESRAR